VIQIKAKAKITPKPKKKAARKVSPKITRNRADVRPDFTPEDIAEINMFSAAIAKMNWEAEKKNWAKIVAKAKAEAKAKRAA